MAVQQTFPFQKESNEGNKRLSVERIYQKKTQLEHVLLRPDTYIGSTEESIQPMWVYDKEKEAILQRQITYVPGLYKIFDEILVNAADNKQRDPKMNSIKIKIDPENNLISVWNNGMGIPVEMHAVEKMYVPQMIFGTLLTSSNYDDDQRKVTGGRNGYGAKLCNIFSTEFTVETASSQSGKLFKQTWKDNMGSAGKISITSSKSDFTRVTFKPDLSKFKMTHLDNDIVSLMTRRAYDVAGGTKGVSVYLNGEKLAVKNFKEYVELYLKGQEVSPEAEPRKVVHEVVNPRWEVCVTASDNGFQQSSFVNSIATTKGGTHVTAVVDQVVSKLLDSAKKKNKGGMDLKPFHIKGHLWVFVNCLIENPTFDSQTKENMTLKAKSFGSTCQLSDKFIKSALSCGVVERVLSWAQVKSQNQLNKKQHVAKNSKLKGIPKLDDANDAGTKHALTCTLIVTEGDSAKTLAVSGLGVVGRDKYGVFPLRGKLLNVREASHGQIMANEEIKNIVKILGLQYGKKYIERTELNSLRYGRLMIMADQDQDGSHIKGLVINFIHHNWPHLLRHGFVEEFITPIVKVSKGKHELSFFSLPEFEKWQAETDNSHTWKVKYYKGLGTSTSKEAKEYFSDMEKHRIPFKYSGDEDDKAIELAFSKKLVNERKEWLTSFLQTRKENRSQGMNESFLYGGEKTEFVSYSDFINKELILFSNTDNERSIPSVVDGVKPGQRKVLFTCFKRNDKREVKVAQLAGSVGEQSAYHHGEASLMATIINLAQNYVGSNNINLLQPIGQFGTRLHGGKDAASPRYIFTKLNPLTRRLFPIEDDPILNYLTDDNQRVEPEWYCPIIPTILVNGAEGIGTGYSTSVPSFDPREIVANVKRMLTGIEPVSLKPFYKNFQGSIAHLEPHKYMSYGRVARLDGTTIEITELPIRSWTQHYKESVLEPMLHGTEKSPVFITDYKEYHTDTTVKFVVSLSATHMAEAESIGFHKKFKLESSISTNNMVLFDADGCLKRYETELEILKEFYETRLSIYRKRKEYLESMLTAESLKLDNQARFILEKIEGKIVLEKRKKKDVVADLVARGYDSDPVKAWKARLSSGDDNDDNETEREEEGTADEGPDYGYLLSMALLSLTHEKVQELLKSKQKKAEELKVLKEKTNKDLWKEDLDKFLEELDEVEEKERQEASAGMAITTKKKKGGTGRQAKMTASGALSSGTTSAVTKPSPFAEVIPPNVPDFCAEKVKKPARKPKKEKELPGQTKLKFSGDSAEKETVEKDQLLVEEDSNEPPLKKKKREPTRKRKPIAAFSDEDDDDIDILPIDEDEEIEELMPTKKKPAGKKEVKLAAKETIAIDVSDDDDFQAKKKQPAKKPAVKKVKKVAEKQKKLDVVGGSKKKEVKKDDSIQPPPVKKQKAPQKKKTVSSDSEEEAIAVAAPRVTRRPTKQVQYHFSDEDESESDDQFNFSAGATSDDDY